MLEVTCPVCRYVKRVCFGDDPRYPCRECRRKMKVKQPVDKPVDKPLEAGSLELRSFAYMPDIKGNVVDNSVESVPLVSNNVLLLPGAPVPSNQPSQKVIELLEDLLAKAKAGDVSSVGVVWLNGGRQVFTGWESEGQYMTLLGGVTWLQQRMAESDG